MARQAAYGVRDLLLQQRAERIAHLLGPGSSRRALAVCKVNRLMIPKRKTKELQNKETK